MRRSISAVAVALLCTGMLFATPYEEILSRAMENSPQMKNVELTYLNSLLTQQQNDLDDAVKVTVSTGTISVLPNENTPNTLPRIPGFTDDPEYLEYILAIPAVEEYLKGETINADFTMSPSVTVVLPNDGETTISASTGLGFEYGDGKYYSVTPSLSASHTFDLTGYDSDLAVDLSNARSSIQSEYTYRNALLSFENQVLTSIKTILQAERTLDETKYELAKAEQTLSDALELGNMSEGSVSYLQSMNAINLQKRTIDATEKQIETAKQQYTTLTGLVWDGVEDLPSPDLTVNVLSTGNTSVVLAGIDVEIAQQEIETKQHEISPSSIAVAGGVNSSLSQNKKTLGTSAGLSYSAGNWSLGTTFGGTYTYSTDKFTPSLTFTGTWTNKTTKKSDEIELQMLNNDLVSAQNELADAKTSYIQDMQNLQIEILNHEYTLQNNAAQKEYYESNLEYQQTLFDSGLCTQQDVDDARKQVEWASVQDMIDTIEGLLLQIKIAQLNL